VPGGPLTSKPAWSNASGCSDTPAFFGSVFSTASSNRSHPHEWQDRRGEGPNQGSRRRGDRQRRASRGGQDRPGGRQGQASRREGRRQGRASREKSARVKL